MTMPFAFADPDSHIGKKTREPLNHLQSSNNDLKHRPTVKPKHSLSTRAGTYQVATRAQRQARNCGTRHWDLATALRSLHVDFRPGFEQTEPDGTSSANGAGSMPVRANVFTFRNRRFICILSKTLPSCDRTSFDLCRAKSSCGRLQKLAAKLRMNSPLLALKR